jgi:hypothetical protein
VGGDLRADAIAVQAAIKGGHWETARTHHAGVGLLGMAVLAMNAAASSDKNHPDWALRRGFRLRVLAERSSLLLWDLSLMPLPSLLKTAVATAFWMNAVAVGK